MPAPITAASVMDRSAALLNNVALTVYSYTVQLPYLNIAYDELKEELEEDNVPMTNAVSANITVAAGANSFLSYSSVPPYPADLIDIRDIWERPSGTNNQFVLMHSVDFLPKAQALTAYLQWYTWQGQVIRFIGATGAVEVQLNYIADNLPALATSLDTIALFNAKSFLQYRNAALCAEFVGENKTRADSLNAYALMALERLLNISAKGRQKIATRRRPFMASYRQRGII